MKKLTKKELKMLPRIIESLECDAIKQYHLRSGAFAYGNMCDYDNETITIELEFGIQDDVTSDVNTDFITINRKTMEVVN